MDHVEPPSVRDATPGDMEAVARIYGHYVRETVISFELEAPSAEEMARRRDAVLALGLPYLVAETAEGVVGYAYATEFRSRPAYRFTIEDSVYVAPAQVRRGVGAALLAELLRRVEPAGFRQMVAGISETGNPASEALHRAFGFERVGVYPAVGFKHGRWVDVLFLQRPLGAGAATPPV